MPKSRKIILCFDSIDVLDACERFLFKKKIIKNNHIKNDKTEPYYVIIETKVDKKSLIKILNKTFKGQYYMR